VHPLSLAYHAAQRLSKGDARPEGSDVLGRYRSIAIRDNVRARAHREPPRAQLAIAGARLAAALVEPPKDRPLVDARALAREVEREWGGREVDVLIADLPYGQDSPWKRLQKDGPSSCSPRIQMLDAF
jgi:hypothetical protein